MVKLSPRGSRIHFQHLHPSCASIPLHPSTKVIQSVRTISGYACCLANPLAHVRSTSALRGSRKLPPRGREARVPGTTPESSTRT